MEQGVCERCAFGGELFGGQINSMLCDEPALFQAAGLWERILEYIVAVLGEAE